MTAEMNDHTMILSSTKRERMLGALKRKLEGYIPWDINHKS